MAHSKMLACPFYKRDLRNYHDVPTCDGRRWPTINRLKHISPFLTSPTPLTVSHLLTSSLTENTSTAVTSILKPDARGASMPLTHSNFSWSMQINARFARPKKGVIRAG